MLLPCGSLRVFSTSIAALRVYKDYDMEKKCTREAELWQTAAIPASAHLRSNGLRSTFASLLELLLNTKHSPN